MVGIKREIDLQNNVFLSLFCFIILQLQSKWEIISLCNWIKLNFFFLFFLLNTIDLSSAKQQKGEMKEKVYRKSV